MKKNSARKSSVRILMIVALLFISFTAAGNNDLEPDPEITPQQQFIKNSNNLKADSSPIVINELAAWNTCLLEDEDGDYSDWVELYNNSNAPVNLKGWYLSDDRTDLTKWVFSASKILNPGEYQIIYLSGKDRRTGRDGQEFHTNFALQANYETLLLTSIKRNVMDSLEAHAPEGNISFKRTLDGSESWELTSSPTPGERNDLVLPVPAFNLSSGFYTPDATLEIEAENIPEGCELRYTVNDGVEISASDQALNRFDWQYPSNMAGIAYSDGISLEMTSVIKARYYKGKTAGPEAVYSYFINEDIAIPVISLTVDPADLWDPERGIYVTGDDPLQPNYLSEDMEVPARFTYFSSGTASSPEIDEDCRLRIFGSATREFPNKSLAILARDRQIDNYFFHNNSSTVYSLLLRTGATDFPRGIMRDMITSELVRPLGLEVQDYQQALLFINGQFWGISNIREKVNEEMLEDKYQVDPEKLDLIFSAYTTEVKNGLIDDYNEMLEFLTTANLNLDRYYNQVENFIDIDNLIDYLIVETYINNSDWPNNNVKIWKTWDEESRWRWILYDTDAGYDTVEFWTRNNTDADSVIGRPDFNSIDRLLTSLRPVFIVEIFQNLMNNDQFRIKFIERYEELVGIENGEVVNANALLGTNRILSIVDSLAANIEPYIDRQISRWQPEYSSYMLASQLGYDNIDIDHWIYQVGIIKDFARQRPQYITQFLEKIEKEFIASGKNLVENGNFDNGGENWNLGWSDEVSVQEIITIDDNNVGHIVIADNYIPRTNPADIVAFVHDGIPLEAGERFTLSFRMRSNIEASTNETAMIYLFNSDPPYTRYGSVTIPPADEWEIISTVISMNYDSNPDSRLQFRLGMLPAGTELFIDDISLIEME